MIETILQDLRYSVRLFAAQRGFSLIALITLAVGVGLSTALFSVIHAALLRPLPYPEPERLVSVQVRVPSRTGPANILSPSLIDVRAWRADQRVFSHIAVERGEEPLNVDTGETERVQVQRVSEGYFEVFGISPIIGRTFSAEESRPQTPGVALVGHSYWRARFGADPGIAGRQIRLGGRPTTIVGVLPVGFYPRVPLWQPLGFPAVMEPMRGTGADIIGRLQPGVSLERAENVLSKVAEGLDVAEGRPPGAAVTLRSLHAETVAGNGAIVSTLSGAVAAILLIACVNVAGLLLARGATRHRELAIRASIGAGRARLVRQLLTESVVLACAGGLGGVLLAWLSLDALVAILPLSLPPNATPSLNLEVLAFSVAVAMLTSLLFGLVPALRLSRARVTSALAGSDRRSGAALPKRSGQWLIAIEVALGVVLLTGSALMIRSFARLVSVDLGFNPASFVTLEVSPLDPAPAVAAEYYPALVAAIRQLPDVEVAGAGNQLPIGGPRRAGFVPVDGQPVRIDERQVLPGFFEAMGMPLKQGRLPTEADRTSGRPLVVINELAATQIFRDVSPVGHTLPIAKVPPEILGVVGNFLQDGARSPMRANVYWVYTGTEPLGRSQLAIFVRPRGATPNLSARLREVAHSVGPRVVVDRIRSGEDFVSESVAVPRRRMVLLGLLGGVGLLLTVVGIFSMTAYAVARRTREIGVRMAFGADTRDVVRAMVRDAAWPVALGLMVGTGGAYLATRVIVSLLFQTRPYDPLAYAAALATLAVSAVVAAWLPARRAALVDPVSALRAE